MSLLDTALRIANYKPVPFIAPVPINGTVNIFAMQNNVPLRYAVHGKEPGWYQLLPEKRKVVVGREAYVFEYMQYLQNLKHFYAIACIPSGDKSWLSVPYNASDAAQRGWKNGEPRQVYLVNENLEPFDVIVVCQLVDHLIFESIDYRIGRYSFSKLSSEIAETSVSQRDWRNAFDIFLDWQRKAEQEAIRERLERQLLDSENKMKFLLEFMGARFVSREKAGLGYVVVWESPDGHKYKMGVKEDGRISVAGFCLSGTDEQHNLSSIVSVMEEAHRLSRPDIEQTYADYEEDEDW